MKLIKKIAAAALSAGLVAPQGARAALVSARANAGTGAAPAFAPAALGQLGLPAPSATGLDGTLSVTTGIDLAAPSPSIGAAASALAPIGAAAADQTAPEPGAVRTSAPDVAPTDGRRAAQEHVSAVAQQVGDIGKGFANARSSEAGFGSGLALQAAVTGERFSAAPGGAEPTAAPANAFVAAYREQFARAVIGQTAMRDAMLLALLAGGHVLLEGNPGVAKTRSVLTLGEMTELSAKRIQFTRDLQPFDITGQEEKDRHTEKWDIRRGPIFNNLVLADEINRAKPQTQGALLEAMEEGRVTIAGQTLDLPQPFMVLATQNNLNDAGTYPLPSAQLDRFMFKIRVPNLSEAELAQMLSLLSQDKSALSRVITREGLLEARARAAKVTAGAEVLAYVARLIAATRPDVKSAPEAVKKGVTRGGSDRAANVLLRAARAHAYAEGRDVVLPEDVKAVAHWVLDHRVILTFEAEANTTPEAVVEEVLKTTPVIVKK